MKHTFRLLMSALLALAAMIVPVEPARAHPHNFISVRVQVPFAADGQVAVLQQDWMFDELYTGYMLGGDLEKIIKSGDVPTAVQEKMTSNIKSLEEYGWFIRVEQNGQRLALAGVDDFQYRMEEERLAVSFTATLAQPVSLADMPLSYAVYDPTYYVMMHHDTRLSIAEEFTGSHEQARRKRAAKATMLKDAPPTCHSRITFSDPSEATILGALMLDRGESVSFDLGAEFAEWVTISCK